MDFGAKNSPAQRCFEAFGKKLFINVELTNYTTLRQFSPVTRVCELINKNTRCNAASCFPRSRPAI